MKTLKTGAVHAKIGLYIFSPGNRIVLCNTDRNSKLASHKSDTGEIFGLEEKKTINNNQ